MGGKALLPLLQNLKLLNLVLTSLCDLQNVISGYINFGTNKKKVKSVTCALRRKGSSFNMYEMHPILM